MNRRPIEERFWQRVKKTKTCWLWMGPTMRQGYGVIGRGGRNGLQISTHRLSYKIHFHDIPKGLHVLHKCDVRNCVNPKHLFLGTHIENIKDMVIKGRRKGTKHHLVKFTEKQIIKIRKRYKFGIFGCKKLAKIYNCCPQHIHDIIRRKIWTHI